MAEEKNTNKTSNKRRKRISNSTIKKILAIIIGVTAFIIIITAAWKEELFKVTSGTTELAKTSLTKKTNTSTSSSSIGDALWEFIKAWEGHEGLSDDGTKYKIGSVLGNRTVGYGFDIDANGLEYKLTEAGYSTNLGDYVDVDFIDNLCKEELNTWKEYVEKKVSSCSPTLNTQQIDALTASCYQFGYALDNYDFVSNYNKYGNTDDLKGTFLPFYGGPGSNGRYDANWKLFHEGKYTNASGEEII